MKIGIISDAHMFHRWGITTEMYCDIITNKFANCDIIVDCGDITDRSNLTAPQIDALSKLYKDIDKPVYLVAGNHDSLSNTTVASVFESKKNVLVIREPTIYDTMLFVPYTDDIKTMFKQLNEIVKEPVKYAFSHLNITSNIYASIPFSDTKKLHKYAEIWFNGHIHNDEKNETAFGKVYNVGACSSLTFGDTHTPCYSIYDTEEDYLETKGIDNCVLHRSFNISNRFGDIDLCYSEIEYATRYYRMRTKFYLPNNNDSLDIRRKIKEKLEQNPNVISIVFDYIKDSTKEEKKQEETEAKNMQKIPLMQQLFEHFEKDTQIILSNDIKEELMS